MSDETSHVVKTAVYIRDTWTHAVDGIDVITLDLARAVIALDAEARRLRDESVEREQRVEDLRMQRNLMRPVIDAAEDWFDGTISDIEMRQAVVDWNVEDKPDMPDAPVSFDLAAFFDDKAAWSRETFGPGDRTAGVIAHIRKELDEIAADSRDPIEWVDVVLLAMDGAWRSVGVDGAEFVAVLKAKDGANRMRTWPDWRTLKPGEVSEHVRGDGIGIGEVITRMAAAAPDATPREPTPEEVEAVARSIFRASTGYEHDGAAIDPRWRRAAEQAIRLGADVRKTR